MVTLMKSDQRAHTLREVSIYIDFGETISRLEIVFGALDDALETLFGEYSRKF